MRVGLNLASYRLRDAWYAAKRTLMRWAPFARDRLQDEDAGSQVTRTRCWVSVAKLGVEMRRHYVPSQQ